MRKALSSHRRFIFILPLFDRGTLATLFVIISYSRDPKTHKERALRHPHKRLHPWLRPKQPRELPRNMYAYVTRISNHVPRRRTRCSELRVRGLVSGSLFFEIYLSRAGAVVGSICGECIGFSEQPCELAE